MNTTRMSGCLILGDTAVHNLLINLSKPEILTFQHKLQASLQSYSTSDERTYQPSPGVSVRPNGQKTLFRPFTSPSSVGCKIIVDPAPEETTGKKSPLHGVLVVCDRNGIPAGIVNAEEVTAFRTSLCALIPWMWRRWTQKIVVFGAGKQALWHVRLALALRGSEVKDVVFVNRTRARGEAVVERLRREDAERWGSGARIECVSTSGDDAEVVKKLLAEADVVFCTVPSTTPLFSAKDVQRSSQSRSPFISAIGSWQPSMIELDPALLQNIVHEKGAYNPFPTKNADAGGAILVDDRKSVSEHTGEILQSGLSDEQLVELGQVLELREKKKSGGVEDEDARLEAWLSDGFLIYKSVGVSVSVTDLVSGEAILELAKQRGGMGTLVTDL